MTHNELATIRGVLGTLRAKIRRAWTIRGLAITAAALCVVAVFSFGLDYFLDLPLAVRAVHLCVVLVLLGFVVRWALVRPLGTPMSETDLAQAVEHGAPDLRDRLVSALDFETRLGDADETESRELMTAIVGDAASHAARLDAGLLVDSRPARRALAVAAAAAAVLVAVAVAAPDDFSLWLRRGLLLSDVSWPRRTHIRVLDFPVDGPRIVTRGEDLHVVAVAEGDLPPELVLHFEELAEPDPAKGPDAVGDVTASGSFRMYPVEGEEGHYGYDFRAVSASFRFHVTGGDYQDDQPVYSVLALVAPRVASISGKIVYPAYAGLPDGEVRDANFEVLKGSHVVMAITANMPLALARVIPTDTATATAVPVAADGKSMTLTFDVEAQVDFHLELTARQGQTNRADDDVFHLRPVEDRPPELRVLYPPNRLYRTPNGVVPIKFVAKDDFQVAKVVLEIAIGTTPLGSSVLWPMDGASPPADGKRVDAYRPLDLLQFAGDKGPALKPTDVVHLVLRATDSRGNETSSGDLAVEILSQEDFERRLSQRQGTLREELQILKRGQQRTRTAIAELREAVAKSGPDAAVLGHGRDLQVDQGRVGNDLTQFLSGIRQVFDGYVLDRIGAGTAIDKLLPLYHEALALRSEEEVFPASLYAKIVVEKRADHLYDDQVLGALLDILDLGDRAVSEVSPSVYRSLVAFSSESAHDRAELEKADKAATELAALLVAIDQRMQRWGEMSLLIEMARGVRATEDSLLKDPAGAKGLAPK